MSFHIVLRLRKEVYANAYSGVCVNSWILPFQVARAKHDTMHCVATKNILDFFIVFVFAPSVYQKLFDYLNYFVE